MPTNKGLKSGVRTELRCFFHVRKGHEKALAQPALKPLLEQAAA